MPQHGTEILPNPGAYNPTSRDNFFNDAIPFRHLGMMFRYPFTDLSRALV